MEQLIKYHFFLNGKLSNWYDSEFTIKNITYSCIEQYMMHQKALIFGDSDIADKVMNESRAFAQKELGRCVNNYNDEIWRIIRYQIVKEGVIEKFKQNKDLEDYLKSLKGYTIVEASPYDIVWGIGFEEDEALDNIENWGQNLLGKILTELANNL
jgi:ribA/ribD-fused uncharacterized protein